MYELEESVRPLSERPMVFLPVLQVRAAHLHGETHRITRRAGPSKMNCLRFGEINDFPTGFPKTARTSLCLQST